MPPDPAAASELVASLTRVHRGVLLLLAACAGVIAVGSTGAPAAAEAPRVYTFAALGFALGAILLRQAAPGFAPHRGLRLLLASLVLAGCVGLVGVALALQVGARNTALAYVLGAAILCLRPPSRSLAR